MDLKTLAKGPEPEDHQGIQDFLNSHTASLEKIAIKVSRFDKTSETEDNKQSSQVLSLNELIHKFPDIPHLSKRLFKNIKKMKFTFPLPIQSLSFPLMLKGENMICVAKTGSGKTLSFLLPIYTRLNYFYKEDLWSFSWNDCEDPKNFYKREIYTLGAKPKIGVSVLILVPSKELAIQIFEVAKKLGRKTHIKTGIFLSEDSKKDQFKVLRICKAFL